MQTPLLFTLIKMIGLLHTTKGNEYRDDEAVIDTGMKGPMNEQVHMLHYRFMRWFNDSRELLLFLKIITKEDPLDDKETSSFYV
jgi:hypothetical protein